MSKNTLTYDKDKIMSIMKEIDNIKGFIDENKKEELKSKYPGFRSLNVLINTHNDKLNTKNKNKHPRKRKNKKVHPRKNISEKNYFNPDDEFNKKLNRINHFIRDDEKAKLNPNKSVHLNALIDSYNKNFIRKEQTRISKEFNSDLSKFTTVIDEKQIEKFKSKYNKDYHNFFTPKMEKSIIKFNDNLKKKRMAEVFAVLRQKYSTSNTPISKDVVSDLISKYPKMDWDKLIQKFNTQYFNNKYRKTTDDVFYLNDYIRKDDWDYADSKRVEISKEILKYKDGVTRFVNKFTDEISEFIEDFSNYGVDENIEKIYLVSIPSSTAKRNKNSSMKKTIEIIESNYEKGLINNCEREIINFSDALERIEDVKTAHRNSDDRPKYEDHIRTIEFSNEKGYDFENSVFLVLDDITTTGTIMSACEDILVKKNIKRNKIYKLAIAATE